MIESSDCPSGRSRIGTRECNRLPVCLRVAIALRGDRGLERYHRRPDRISGYRSDCPSGRSRIGTRIRWISAQGGRVAIALRGDRGLERAIALDRLRHEVAIALRGDRGLEQFCIQVDREEVIE